MTTFKPSLELPSPLDSSARRVEIDEFIVDNAMNNLYLLAMRDMQLEQIKKIDDKTEDWFSYYDISGELPTTDPNHVR